jgi:uncharacterized protein (DUF1015 family)
VSQGPLVKPFRALRFDEAKAGQLDQLVAPPYDVILPGELEQFVSRSPFNVVRLIRPHEPELAANRLREWIEAGALVRESKPAIWRIEEEYVGPEGVPRTRRGLVARIRLRPYDHRVVVPHERVFAGPAESRLRLLRATRAKLSPVLLLHPGESPLPVERAPDLEATLQGTTTRLWSETEPDTMEALIRTVQAPLVIADGHHRYEAALRFHEEEGTEETGWLMAALVSLDDPGLTIFPTHRVVTGPVPELNGGFRMSPVDGGAAEAVERLERAARDRPAFVLLERDGAVLVEQSIVPAKPLERLDVSAVDALPLSGVTYTPHLREAQAAVENGRARAAFLVRAPTVADVQEIARAGLTMPEKSTYFHPKLTSGLLFSPFDE